MIHYFINVIRGPALMLALALGFCTVCSGQMAHPYSDERLAPLMSQAVFQLSFDGDSMNPDLTEGELQPPVIKGSGNGKFAAPVFADGLVGRGLVLGTGDAAYQWSGTNPFPTSGAVAFWVYPESWNHQNGANVNFVHTPDNAFIIQRQGPRIENGRRTKREHLGVGANSGRDKDRKYFAIGVPPDRTWSLIIVNWAWPTFALSVNGQAFISRSLKGVPEPDSFPSFLVGTRHGNEAERAIMDELYIFKRPVTREEAWLLYSLCSVGTTDDDQ